MDIQYWVCYTALITLYLAEYWELKSGYWKGNSVLYHLFSSFFSVSNTPPGSQFLVYSSIKGTLIRYGLVDLLLEAEG